MTNSKQFKKLINLNIDEFMNKIPEVGCILGCLLYTSDAADE